MMVRKAWRNLLLAALLAGCAALPERHIYVLGATTEPAPGVRDDTGRPVIEVKPVLVPDHLDITDILLRTGSNELRPSDTGVWGERLSVGITQALAGALARRIPSALVVSRPPAVRPSLQILVDITALEARAGGDCVLTANWTILRRRTDGGAPQTVATAHGSFVTHADGPGDAAVVAAITGTIDQLASQIASQIAARMPLAGR
jgi:uncharacterized lipoprotein YmbA